MRAGFHYSRVGCAATAAGHKALRYEIHMRTLHQLKSPSPWEISDPTVLTEMVAESAPNFVLLQSSLGEFPIRSEPPRILVLVVSEASE